MSPLTLRERIALRRLKILPASTITKQEYGHYYGKIGGPARAQKLSKKRRVEIARIASAAAKKKRDAAKSDRPDYFRLFSNDGKNPGYRAGS